MKTCLRHLCLMAWLFAAAVTAEDTIVIRDGEISISREELEHIVAEWNSQMREDAANSISDRMELLNRAMASKKIAGEAEAMTPEKDGDAYWQKELMVRRGLQDYMVRRYIRSIEVPDLSALAEERYISFKDKYAAVAPRRRTSHILLLCPAGGNCDREAKLAKAQELLAQLRAGADFEALVKEYSQDPGSRSKKGLFDAWLEPGMRGVDRQYLKGAFSIQNVGEYSNVVSSQYGLHIIRLDKAEDAYYKTFEEVKPKIMADLREEYLQLSVKIFDEDYRFTDDLYIDGEAMEEIFSPFKTVE